MKIAVVGATGHIGRAAVDVLNSRGHQVVEIARATGVDVYTGEGLAAALSGVQVVLDTTNAPSTETDVVQDFFATTARNVQQAAAAAGCLRIIVVSIIGIDAFTAGHYAGKLVQERTYSAGPVPVRIVRAAQFHEFTEMMLAWTTDGDLATIPAMRTQLVDTRTVAEKLVEIGVADDGPTRLDIAGPGEIRLVDAVAMVAARRGTPARVTETADVDDPDHLRLAGGALLPGPDAILAGPTFAEWLDEHHPAR